MPRDLNASEVHIESDADREGSGGVSSRPFSAPKKSSGLMGHFVLEASDRLSFPTSCFTMTNERHTSLVIFRLVSFPSIHPSLSSNVWRKLKWLLMLIHDSHPKAKPQRIIHVFIHICKELPYFYGIAS